MANLDSLLDAVKRQIRQHVTEGGHDDFDTDGLLGKITNLFGAHKSASNVRPASDDPYGDHDQLIGRRH